MEELKKRSEIKKRISGILKKYIKIQKNGKKPLKL